MELNKIGVITAFLSAIVTYNIPILYGTVGEIMVEKSGSLNLGVEGIMAVGAIFGYLAGCYTNSFVLGIIVAFLAAALCGMIFSVLTITFHANQNITGLTIATFGVGVFFFVGNGIKGFGEEWWPKMDVIPEAFMKVYQKVAGAVPESLSGIRGWEIWDKIIEEPSVYNGFHNKIKIPYLSDIPVIGEGFFNQNILVYFGVAIAILVWVYFKYTPAGLRLRAIGENPAAADSVGINVNLMKYVHICIGCGIMGIGGYYMGLNLGGLIDSTCWINGYGWIAVALVIFANWNPVIAILGTFVFGFFNTLYRFSSDISKVLPGAFGWLENIPTQVYSALPFIITAIVLVATSIINKRGKSGLPAALGLNYFREDR